MDRKQDSSLQDMTMASSQRYRLADSPEGMQSRQGQEKNKFRNASNIHQLYQDLFITDMKDEIAVASNEVVQLRQELLEKDNQNQMLKKQNSELKSKVKCYRKLVADLNRGVKGG